MWKGYNVKFIDLIKVHQSPTEGDFTIAKSLLLCSQQCGWQRHFKTF